MDTRAGELRAIVADVHPASLEELGAETSAHEQR
jgi:hypothetical protein